MGTCNCDLPRDWINVDVNQGAERTGGIEAPVACFSL